MASTRSHRDPNGIESEEEYCVGQFPEGCGAKVVEYQHRLNRPMIRALLSLWRAAGKKAGVPRHLEQDCRMNRSENRNFQKLRYFGLAEKSFDAEGLRIQGCWNITRKGELFITGFGYCRPTVWTWRGDPVEFEGEPIEISDVSEPAWLAEDFAAHARVHEDDEKEDDDG